MRLCTPKTPPDGAADPPVRLRAAGDGLFSCISLVLPPLARRCPRDGASCQCCASCGVVTLGDSREAEREVRTLSKELGRCRTVYAPPHASNKHCHICSCWVRARPTLLRGAAAGGGLRKSRMERCASLPPVVAGRLGTAAFSACARPLTFTASAVCQ